MADLPELEQEEKQAEEQAEVQMSAGKSQRNFFMGLLMGIVLTLIFIFVFSGGWFLARWQMSGNGGNGSDQGTNASVLTDPDTLYKLNEVQSLIEQNYLEEVDGKNLESWLFRGIAYGLGDPYADYYSAEEMDSVMAATRGEYHGIGVVLLDMGIAGGVIVEEVYAGSPAERAGIQEGDVLLGLDQISFEGMDLSEVVSTIKKYEDSFTLHIFRPENESEMDLMVYCTDVEINYVEYKLLEDGVGYLRLSEFTESAVGQFNDAVSNMQEQGMEHLIVDLRDNPGGLLDAVCDILDEILPEGLIVYTEGRSGERSEELSDNKRSVTCPVAVLVNGKSASASEIFAGAIQDYEIGPVIGTKTYGKGIVQARFMLSDGSSFKMTTQTYYTPKGQNIHGNGITPDIVVETEAASEEGSDKNSDKTDNEAENGKRGNPATDPVLKKAVEVLTEK